MHRPVFTINIFRWTFQPNALQATLLIGLTLAAMHGCADPGERKPKQLDVKDVSPVAAPVTPPIAVEKAPDRFKIESQGYFNAGHQNNSREILIITDIKTGKEYLGITGVGVTELVRYGKHTTDE